MKKQSKSINLICFGFGLTAKYFVKELIKNKYKINLIATSRSKSSINKIFNISYKNFYLDEEKFDKKIIKYINESTHILVSIPPRDRIDYVIKNFRKYLIATKKLKWLGYLSSTGVYGDHKGKWVNEKSKLLTTSETGINRIIAENVWLQLHRNQLIPARVFRLSGIYSLERNIFSRIKNNHISYYKKTNHYFSRIHVKDIALVLFKSLKFSKAGEIYNVTDNFPCSYETVLMYACSLLKTSVPKATNIKKLKDSEMRHFYQESKKVSNKKIVKNFRLKFNYPTYKQGLKSIFNHFTNS